MLFGKPKHGSLAINVANGFDGIGTDTLCMHHRPFPFTPNEDHQLCCVHGKADEVGKHV